MSTIKRFSWSLLASTVLFIGFCFVAFAGIFPWIESQFYSPQVVADVQSKLQSVQNEVVSWQKATEQRISLLVAQGTFKNVFAPTQSRDALRTRFQNVKLFLQAFHATSVVRILDSTRDRIHFSSIESDVLASGDFSVSYKRLSVANPSSAILDAKRSIDSLRISYDVPGKYFAFVSPFKDEDVEGYLLVQVAIEDLTSWLFEKGILPQNDSFVALADGSLVWSRSTKLDTSLTERVQLLTKQGILPPVQSFAQANSSIPLVLVTVRGNVGLGKPQLSIIVPQTQLELGESQKWVVLASFYTLIFLLVFFLFNLRADPLSSVARKVKRFQLQVLRDYLDLKEQEKIQSLKDELTRHTQQIKEDIRQSLGKIRKPDKEWVDSYIDKSWNEILDLLGSRGGGGQAPPAELDWNRLERFLIQALEKGRFVVSGPTSASSSNVAKPAVAQSERTSETFVKPSEKNLPRRKEAEELEEIADAEEAESIEELEEMGDAEEAESIEELEEIGDAEEAESIEELEEMGDAEEAESIEELEEIGDAEEAESIEELEEMGDAEEVESIEELEEMGDAEEAESIEELEDAVVAEREVEEGAIEELEVLEDESEVSELVELPVQDSTSNLFPYARGGQMDSPLGTLESVDEPEGELEVLEDDAISGVPAVLQPEVVRFDLDRLDEVWRSKSSTVFDESDEVVTLNADLFRHLETPQDDLGQLLQDVITDPQFDSEDAEGFPTLSDDFVPARKVREWLWTGGGFDWDRFVRSQDETEQYKALSEASKAFGAFSAALLISSPSGWEAQMSLGFSDEGKLKLTYASTSKWVDEFLSVRALHVIKEDAVGRSILKQAFHERDLKYLHTIVLVPVLHEKKPAWILLGFRGYPANLEDILKPRVV